MEGSIFDGTKMMFTFVPEGRAGNAADSLPSLLIFALSIPIRNFQLITMVFRIDL